MASPYRLPDSAAPVSLYPPGPAEVPADLLAPTPAYKRQAYVAIACLLGFIAVYFAFTSWLVWMAVHGFSLAFAGRFRLGLFIVSACAALLAVFLVKSLFFIKRAGQPKGREVTAEEEPQLFAFLHQLADEAKAPRPHRVFLSPDVNACVFYDISLLNFIWPSKKNLELGLGLVNAVTLSELKAVLAHELGHFAQRTMATTPWVYIAMQVTGQLVHRRDGFDHALAQLTRLDLRVAWIGWLMQLVVWATRSVMETVSLSVVVADRALGREMERQADLVAAALTGSDALVHALYKMRPASQALGQAFDLMEKEARDGRAMRDVLAVQTRVIEKMRDVLCDPLHGAVPALPEGDAAATHRVFAAKLAYPPKMWATHPPSDEREENVKRRYLRAPLDDRSGWILFRDAEATRAQMTEQLYVEGKRPEQVATQEETFAALDALLGQPFYDPSYRGAYLGRSPVDDAEHAHKLYGEEPEANALPAELAALYPESLRATIVRRDELIEEQGMLKAIERGALQTSSGKRLLYRGKQHPRRELPALLAQTERELDEVDEQLAAHDRRARTAHVAAAKALGEAWPGWEAHLRGALALLHYADHRERDLDDAIGSLNNVISVVLADGNVSDSERERVLMTAHELYAVLAQVHEQAKEVVMGPEVARRMRQGKQEEKNEKKEEKSETENDTQNETRNDTRKSDAQPDSWDAILGPLELPEPSMDHLGDWLSAVNSWAGSASQELMRLRRAALACLLEAERTVATAAASGLGSGPARPAPSPPPTPPARYSPFLRKHARPLQTKLGWWDRFAIADGWFPATLRFTAAATIVGAAAWLGVTLSRDAEEIEKIVSYDGLYESAMSKHPVRDYATVTVYNGLDRTVLVGIALERRAVAPGEAARLSINPSLPHQVRTVTMDGEEIEGFEVQLEHRQGYLYNVASAGLISIWTRQAGLKVPEAGSRRWLPVNAEWEFAPPPPAKSYDGPDIGITAVRSATAGLARARSEQTPYGQDVLLQIAEGHAYYDELDGRHLAGWLRLVLELNPEVFEEVLSERLAKHPESLMLRALEIETALGPRHSDRCRTAETMAKRMNDPDEKYLALLCGQPSPIRNLAMQTNSERWPEHPWLAAGAGRAFADEHRWPQAAERLEKARHRLPGQGLEVLLARVRRAAATGAEADLSDLYAAEPALPWLLGRDDAEGMSYERRRFFETLARGEWGPAELHADSASDGSLWWILAASDGAAAALPAMAVREVERPTDERNVLSAAVMHGLALRLDQREAAAALRERVQRDSPPLATFLDELARGKAKPGSPGERALMTAELRLQGAGYVAAAVALGEQCPAEWRRLGKALLMPGERPRLQ